MGIFTVYDNPEIDAKVAKDLERIVSSITKAFEGISSIFLVGGFGRGEGGVLTNPENALLIQPVNDYDLEIISKARLDKKSLHEMEKKLASDIGISYVHIENHLESFLKKAKPTVYFYDLKYAGRLLYGNSAILDELRLFKPGDINPIEGLYLLITRISSILLAWEALCSDKSPSPQERFFASNQLSKAILACLDAHLIKTKKYNHLYARRRNMIDDIAPEDEEFIRAAKWAVDFKLKPKSDDEADFFALLSVFKRRFLVFAKDYFNSEKNILESDFCKKLRLFPKILLRRIYFPAARQSLWFERYIDSVCLAWSLICCLKDKDNFNMNFIEHSISLIKKINPECYESINKIPHNDKKRLFIELKKSYFDIRDKVF